jgi:hypothetical protein
LTNQRDHFQKSAFHSEDEEPTSPETVEVPNKDALPVDQQQEEPSSAPPPAVIPPTPPPYIVVAERHEVMTSVGPTTVIFRPGQHLASPHLIELARINNIATKEL